VSVIRSAQVVPHAEVASQFALPPEDELDDPDDDPDEESNVPANDESTEPSDASFTEVASTPDSLPPLLEDMLPLVLEPELLPLADPEPEALLLDPPPEPLPLLDPDPELLPASDPPPHPPSAPSLTKPPSFAATSALASEPVTDESAPWPASLATSGRPLLQPPAPRRPTTTMPT
jgi:hypothetical protein